MKQVWGRKRIGQVCIVIAGQSPEGKYYNNNYEGLPFYQGKKEFTNKFIGKPTKWTTKVTKEAISGDILMSVRAPVGPVNFATQKICIGRGLAAIRTTEKINKDFLFYFFLYHENKIVGNEGAVFNSINKTQIENIKIPLPPIPEQKRIVAILDKAFAAIDRAKANAEKNLANAKELFEAYLNKIFANPGDDWEEKKLGDMTNVQSGGTPLKSHSDYWHGSIPWYTSGELNNLYTSTPKEHITEIGLEKSNAKLFPKGSLLIGMYDTAALKMSISDRASAFNQAIAGAKPKPEIDFKFIIYEINFLKEKILNQRRGVRQKNLNLTKIKNISILLPALQKQKMIVNQLFTLELELEKLKTIYQQKRTDLEELKKSILQKAFNGEL